MKNANVIIALVVGLVLGLVIGRMTVEPGGSGDRRTAAREDVSTGTADTSAKAREAAATEHEVFKVDVDGGWRKGSDEALVTIVEFSNFQCGFCARVQPTLEKLMKDYGDKVRVVFMHMPMANMPHAHLAAQAAEAAGAQGKFWEYRAKLFANPRALDRASLEGYADQLGLDAKRFSDDLDKGTFKAKVDSHLQRGQSVGVTGTPAFFINGRSIRGARPEQDFRAVIDEEIKRAEAVLAAGVSRGNLYATLVAVGRDASRPAPDRAQAERAPPARPQFGRPEIANAQSKGADNALVTIVEFSNVQCGFCARVRPTINQIKEEYGNQVRLVYKHQTGPGPGHLVAQAAEAAGEQGKLFEFMDGVFDNRREIDREALEAHAYALGLNMQRFKAALDDGKFSQLVDQHRADGMRVGARGTPTFFINGRLLVGAQPFDRFKEVIDEEIVKAKKLLQEGVTGTDLYARLLDQNEKHFGAAAQAPTIPPARPAIQDRLRPVQDLQRAKLRAPAEAEAEADRVEIDTSTAVFKGSPNAPVTIVEFSAFTCGFCGRVQPTLEQLLREYEGKVRLAFMHRPLGGPGELAAQATMAANEQGKFWEYHDMLFANMRALDRADLERYAQELGLDMQKFRAALDQNKFQSVVARQSQTAVSVGAAGTPTFFINGRKLVGAQPIDAFKQMIDSELQRIAKE